ncbi:Coenzyme F420 hydrogenase/dehydrogenase, beta subunit C-terminal domain [Vulcaniibacterium tengchongense]|uniref:Coenzyme F420-reducing hydrogenase beta subunit n=1 Tax=Vulcaniibacterium tengchongense TaxID=1273429 RepID=A0A3N4VIS8_9GAMM|nr:Coenzyme F420 hydrogenase/dehydrogenase, beta subunit C-terminal domain [Vulcaniibacterium tengchongense]RPE81593.1 coenzyme F420-reducing hydrogenase beta subunit [Vulcaniibacterium tengchongense]
MTAALSPREMVRSGLCIGCGGCAAHAAARGAAMAFDGHGLLRPSGPGDWYRERSPALARTCPFSPHAANEDELAARLFTGAPQADAATGRYRAAYVGHVAEQDFRSRGSSGGLASWLAVELLRRGRIDALAHVAACDEPRRDGRLFRYRLSRSEGEIRAGAQSRYYPVELSQVLAGILAVPGRYAVVGIPCFVKAVQLLRREHPLLRERIRYTLGLFCGHMKSARFADSLAWQMGVAPDEVRAVAFRTKAPQRPANWYRARLAMGDGRVVEQDWWHLVDGDWGAGFFMDPACNFCDDVMAETADVSFGDAWVEPYASDWQGTNVVVARSAEVAALLEEAVAQGRLALAPVDAAFVARTQAAGLRQRREGLAYRLARRRAGIVPRKRVAPDAQRPNARRRLIYRMRRSISRWSHRMFRLARRFGAPWLYLRWARLALAAYHALAYHRGRWGRLVERIGLR